MAAKATTRTTAAPECVAIAALFVVVVAQYASIFILGLDCEHDVEVRVVPEFCRKVKAVALTELVAAVVEVMVTVQDVWPMQAFPTARGISAVQVSSDIDVAHEPHDPDVWRMPQKGNHTEVDQRRVIPDP